MSDQSGAPTPRQVPRSASDFPAEGTHSLAGIGARAGARLVDLFGLGVVVAVVLTVWIAPDFDPEVGLSSSELNVMLAVLVAMSAIYEIGMVGWLGQTLGKMLFGIRVADLATGGQPSWGSSALRFLLPAVPRVLPWPPFALLSLVVYLSALWDPLRRGWHDKAAGTVIVRT